MSDGLTQSLGSLFQPDLTRSIPDYNSFIAMLTPDTETFSQHLEGLTVSTAIPGRDFNSYSPHYVVQTDSDTQMTISRSDLYLHSPDGWRVQYVTPDPVQEGHLIHCQELRARGSGLDEPMRDAFGFSP